MLRRGSGLPFWRSGSLPGTWRRLQRRQSAKASAREGLSSLYEAIWRMTPRPRPRCSGETLVAIEWSSRWPEDDQWLDSWRRRRRCYETVFSCITLPKSTILSFLSLSSAHPLPFVFLLFLYRCTFASWWYRSQCKILKMMTFLLVSLFGEVKAKDDLFCPKSSLCHF